MYEPLLRGVNGELVWAFPVPPNFEALALFIFGEQKVILENHCKPKCKTFLVRAIKMSYFDCSLFLTIVCNLF